VEQFTFDERFQQHYLAFLLRDPVFYRQVEIEIKPELFSSDIAQRLARLVITFAQEHKAPPGELIYQEIERLKRYGQFTPDELKKFNLYLRRLFKIDLQGRTFVLQEHHRFMGHQRMLAMFPEFTDAMSKGDHDRAQKLVNEVSTFRHKGGETFGEFYSADPAERIRRRIEDEGERFFMFIPPLDRILRGQKKKQVCVWLSQRSSIGKTAAMIHLIKSYALQQKRVLAFAIEDGREEYEDKLDMCIAGVTDRDLRDRGRLASHLRRITGQDNRVHIADPPAGCKVSDLINYVSYLETTENWHPDVVIVDYADLLSPEEDERKGNLFGTGDDVYLNLKKWAKEADVLLWTAMQGTRGAMDQAKADQQHAGMSLAKIWHADLVVSINRTPEEEDQGLSQLYVVKNRGGTARFSKTIHSDFTTQNFFVWKGDA